MKIVYSKKDEEILNRESLMFKLLRKIFKIILIFVALALFYWFVVR